MAHLVGKAEAKVKEMVQKVEGPHGHHHGAPLATGPHLGGGHHHVGGGGNMGGGGGVHVPGAGGHHHQVAGGPIDEIKHTVKGGIHKLTGK